MWQLWGWQGYLPTVISATHHCSLSAWEESPPSPPRGSWPRSVVMGSHHPSPWRRGGTRGEGGRWLVSGAPCGVAWVWSDSWCAQGRRALIWCWGWVRRWRETGVWGFGSTLPQTCWRGRENREGASIQTLNPADDFSKEYSRWRSTTVRQEAYMIKSCTLRTAVCLTQLIRALKEWGWG